jgi:hypothetical protein
LGVDEIELGIFQVLPDLNRETTPDGRDWRCPVDDLGKPVGGLREKITAQVSALWVNLILAQVVLSVALVFGNLVTEYARPEIGQCPLESSEFAFQHGSELSITKLR